MIHRVDELPRMAVGLHVLAPRQRLIAGDHAGLAGRAGQRAQLVDHQRIVADGVGRHVAAHQNAVGAQFVHHVELALRAVEIAFETLGAHAVEIAERLEQHDLQPEIVGDAPHVGGRAVEIQQVVLEDLDAFEARRPDRGQLLDEGSADRHGGNRTLHERLLHKQSNGG